MCATQYLSAILACTLLWNDPGAAGVANLSPPPLDPIKKRGQPRRGDRCARRNICRPFWPARCSGVIQGRRASLRYALAPGYLLAAPSALPPPLRGYLLLPSALLGASLKRFVD